MSYLRSVQHYETGVEEGRRQAQSERYSGSLITTLFGFIFSIFFFCVLISPGILCAYLILAAVQHYNAHVPDGPTDGRSSPLSTYWNAWYFF